MPEFPIQFTNPRVSTLAGNAYPTVEALTNKDQQVVEFDPDADGKFYGQVYIPSDFGAITTKKIHFFHRANAITGNARYGVGTDAYTDGESSNGSLTQETEQNIATPATARNMKKVTFTITNALSAGDIVDIEFTRNADDAVNDTLAAPSQILSPYLEIS